MRKRYILTIITFLFFIAWSPQVNAQDISRQSITSVVEDGTVDAESLAIINKETDTLDKSSYKLDSILKSLLQAKKDKNQNKVNEIEKTIKKNKALLISEEAPYNEITSSGNFIHVYVNLVKDFDIDCMKKYAGKIENYDSSFNIATLWVSVDNLQSLAALTGVNSITLVTPPVVNMGSVVSEGDSIEGADKFRKLTGASGKGIKVGVISDGVDNLSSSQATLDLCTVKVLRNNYGGDEGTAILEIVHDLAPNAELYFHDCGTSFLDFNSAVDSLADSGCNIIIDDISWITQPFFEDGVIASHINSVVTNKNIVYVSSAGNSGASHYQKQFNNYTMPSSVNTSHFHDFNPNEQGLQLLPIFLGNNSSTQLVLEWNDKFGASSNDYNMYLFDTSGQIVAYSNNPQDGNDDPIEYIYYENTSGSAQTYFLAVASNKNIPKTIELYNYGGYLLAYNTPADSVFGHAAATNVIAAGAINAQTPDQIAYYSSEGPCTISYPKATIRRKPDVCGIDGVSITGAGGFSSPFYGTSAAAPHIAALAALLWSEDTSRKSSEIKSAILSNTEDLGAPGFDYIYGNGLVSLRKLTPPSAPTNLVVNSKDKSIVLSWSANTEQDLCKYQVEYRKSGTTTWITNLVSKTLTSYTFSNLANGINYEFRIKARDTDGNWSLYSDVITAP